MIGRGTAVLAAGFALWLGAPVGHTAANACDLVNRAVGGLLDNPNSLVLNLNCAIPAGPGEFAVRGAATILGQTGIVIDVVFLREGSTARLKTFSAQGFPASFSADALIRQLARQLPGGATFSTSAFTPSSLPVPRLEGLRLDFAPGNTVDSLTVGFAANTWPLGPLQIEEPRLEIALKRSTGPEALLSGRFLPAPEIRSLLGIDAALSVTARFSDNPNAAVLSASLGTSLTISSAARLTNLRLEVRPFDRSLALGATLEAQIEPGKPVLKFDGDLGLALAPLGPGVSGTLALSAIGNRSGSDLEWDQPFGIPGVSVRNLKFGLGVTFPPGAPPVPSRLELFGDGLLGTTAQRMSGLIGLGMDATNPSNNYLVYSARSPVTIAAFIRAFSTATLPAELEQGLAAGLQSLNASVSPRDLSVGGETIPAGIRFAGIAEFFGKGVEVDLRAHQGALAMSMSDIAVTVEGIQVLRIGGVGGNPLTFSVDPGTGSNPPKPGLRLDGSVTVLGVTRNATVNITSRHFAAQLGGEVDVLGTSLSGSLRVTAENFTRFDVPQDYIATFLVSLGTVQAELRDAINAEVESVIGVPLGNLFTDVLTLQSLSISTKLGLQQLGAAASIRGTFLGQAFDETLDIDLNLTDTASLFADFIETKVATALLRAGDRIGQLFTDAYTEVTGFFANALSEVEAWFDSLINDPKVTPPSNGQEPPNAILPDDVLKFTVSAKVEATRLDGEDGALEVYGQIACTTAGSVWANQGANAFLFSRRSGNAVDNPPDGHQSVTTSPAALGIAKTFYVTSANRPGARVRVHVRLREYDPSIFDTDDTFSELDLDLPLQLDYRQSYERIVSTGRGEDIRLTVTMTQDKRWGSRNGAWVRYGDTFFIRGLSGTAQAADAWISGDRPPIEAGLGRVLVRDLNAHGDRSLNAALYQWTLYDAEGNVRDRELRYDDVITLSVDLPLVDERRWLRGYLGDKGYEVRTAKTRDAFSDRWRVASRIGGGGTGPVRYGDPIVLVPLNQMIDPGNLHYLNWGLNSTMGAGSLIGARMGLGAEDAGTAPENYVFKIFPLPFTYTIGLGGTTKIVFEKVVLPPNQAPRLNVDWAALPAEAAIGDALAAFPVTAQDPDGRITRVVLQATQLSPDGLPERVVMLVDDSPNAASISRSVGAGTAQNLGVGLFTFQVQITDDRGKTVAASSPSAVRINSGLAPRDIAGVYHRNPVENDWHRGTIVMAGENRFRWINAAGVSWDLVWEPGGWILETGPDNPYYDEPEGRTFKLWQDGTGAVFAFFFQRELYLRTGPAPEIGLNRLVYLDKPGVILDDFYPNPRGQGQFPPGAASSDEVPVLDFESPVNSLTDAGTVLYGYLVPPVTGSYVFYISSDDQGELWLSPNASPAEAVRIAFEPEWNPSRDWTGTLRRPFADNRLSNISAPIPLTAGEYYYVEAMMKEGAYNDSLGVAWRMPGGIPPTPGSPPISGLYLRTALGPMPRITPVLGFRQFGSILRLEWDATSGAVLEYARNVAGPWNVHPRLRISIQDGTAQTDVNASVDPEGYFRLRQP